MSNGLFDDIDLTTVISDETIRQRFVVSSEQITGEEAEVSDPPGDADRVFNATQDEGFDSIQDAIDEANDGDTIQLNDDTFEEDLTIEVPNITIEALEGVTIIGVVTIDVSGVRIEGCEFAPDDNVEQIVFVADSADNVEIEDCSFSGTANIALVFEGDEGEVINCVFDDVDVTEHILVVDGTDVEVSGCTFLVINEIEVVRVEADGVEIDDCDFDAEDVVVERFIIVVDAVVDVIIRECDFAGEVEFEVVQLRADDSRILDCNFEDVVKTDLSVSIIVVTGDNADIQGCVFLVSEALESVVFVDGADGVEIDDCDFEVIDGVAVDRFIFINSASVDVVVIRCVFIGFVNDTTIEHAGSGDGSEIRDCDFDDVELEDGATLIIRVDDVTVEEVDVQIVEIDIGDEFQVFSSLVDAIDAAEEDASIIVQPGTYATDDSIFVETPGLDIQGPRAGISGDNDARVPGDPEIEAVIEDVVTVVVEGVTVDGFSIQDTVAVEALDEDEIAIQNNVIEVDEDDEGVSVDIFADSTSTSIESNQIVNADLGVSVDGTNELTSSVSDVLEVTDNTIEDANTGIELRPGDDIVDDELRAIRGGNEFEDTETEIRPDPDETVLTVTEDPVTDAEFETLSEIFDADPSIAAELDADTIVIEPGQYSEADEDDFDGGAFEIDQENLTITSQAGPEETTLENISFVEIVEPNVTIEGIEFTSDFAEAPIFVRADATTIIDVEFSDFPGDGLTVDLDVDSVTIEDSVISEAELDEFGSDVVFSGFVSSINGVQPDSASEIAEIVFDDNDDIGIVAVDDDEFTPDE